LDLKVDFVLSFVHLRFSSILTFVTAPDGPEFALALKLRWLNDLSVNLVVSMLECDTLAWNQHGKCHDGRSVKAHDRPCSQELIRACDQRPESPVLVAGGENLTRPEPEGMRCALSSLDSQQRLAMRQQSKSGGSCQAEIFV